MRKCLLVITLICVFTASQAQKLTLEQLDHMLNSSLDETEESLFLIGYTFLSKESLPDSAGLIYKFTNRRKTIGTAKVVFKGVYNKEVTKSFVKYVTYDRLEFENFRKLMIDNQFERSGADKISENSNYSKANLKVNFEVTTDEYENKTFNITLQNNKISVVEAPKKLSLKSIFKQP